MEASSPMLRSKELLAVLAEWLTLHDLHLLMQTGETTRELLRDVVHSLVLPVGSLLPYRWPTWTAKLAHVHTVIIEAPRLATLTFIRDIDLSKPPFLKLRVLVLRFGCAEFYLRNELPSCPELVRLEVGLLLGRSENALAMYLREWPAGLQQYSFLETLSLPSLSLTKESIPFLPKPLTNLRCAHIARDAQSQDWPTKLTKITVLKRGSLDWLGSLPSSVSDLSLVISARGSPTPIPGQLRKLTLEGLPVELLPQYLGLGEDKIRSDLQELSLQFAEEVSAKAIEGIFAKLIALTVLQMQPVSSDSLKGLLATLPPKLKQLHILPVRRIKELISLPHLRSNFRWDHEDEDRFLDVSEPIPELHCADWKLGAAGPPANAKQFSFVTSLNFTLKGSSLAVLQTQLVYLTHLVSLDVGLDSWDALNGAVWPWDLRQSRLTSFRFNSSIRTHYNVWDRPSDIIRASNSALSIAFTYPDTLRSLCLQLVSHAALPLQLPQLCTFKVNLHLESFDDTHLTRLPTSLVDLELHTLSPPTYSQLQFPSGLTKLRFSPPDWIPRWHVESALKEKLLRCLPPGLSHVWVMFPLIPEPPTMWLYSAHHSSQIECLKSHFVTTQAATLPKTSEARYIFAFDSGLEISKERTLLSSIGI